MWLSFGFQDVDDFFEHEKTFLLEYHNRVKDASSKSDRMIRSHKSKSPLSHNLHMLGKLFAIYMDFNQLLRMRSIWVIPIERVQMHFFCELWVTESLWYHVLMFVETSLSVCPCAVHCILRLFFCFILIRWQIWKWVSCMFICSWVSQS